MSLINRMLKDLSSREPDSGNLMAGIQVSGVARARKPALLPRLGGLLVLVTVFTAGLWWIFGPRSVPVPLPRSAPAGYTAAAPAAAPSASTGDNNSISMTPAAAPVASAPAPETNPDGAVLQLDAKLSTSDAPAPAAPDSPIPSSEADALYQQGRRAQDSGDLAGAERNYILALRANPRTHPAREALIAMRIDQGHLAAAGRSLELGLMYAPRRAAFLRLSERLKAAGGSIQPLASASPAQLETPRTAPAAKPDTPAPAERGTREEQALRLIEQGRLTEAAEIVSQGREQEAAWSGYRRLAARIELARNQPAAAVALLERDPPTLADDPEHHGLLASAYQRLNRHEDAARVYQGLLRSRPGEAHWWAGYAISQDSLGESAEALKAYAQARKLGQLDARVLEYINQRLAVLNDDRQ